jgi:hypothetical protein
VAALIAPAATAAATGSAPAITAAKAKKLARAGVLTAADMPGYTGTRNPYDPTDAADDKAFYACLGAKVPTYVARNRGASYEKGPRSMDSSSYVLPSVKAAKADLKASTSAKVPGCMKQALKRSVEREGATVRSVTVKKVPVTVAGADGAFAYRIVLDAQVDDILIRIAGFQVGVLVGQTEISLSPTVVNGPPSGLKKAATLGATLVKRVRAAS